MEIIEKNYKKEDMLEILNEGADENQEVVEDTITIRSYPSISYVIEHLDELSEEEKLILIGSQQLKIEFYKNTIELLTEKDIDNEKMKAEIESYKSKINAHQEISTLIANDYIHKIFKNEKTK